MAQLEREVDPFQLENLERWLENTEQRLGDMQVGTSREEVSHSEESAPVITMFWDIPEQQLRLLRKVASGAGGTVWQGESEPENAEHADVPFLGVEHELGIACVKWQENSSKPMWPRNSYFRLLTARIVMLGCANWLMKLQFWESLTIHRLLVKNCFPSVNFTRGASFVAQV